MTEKETAEGFWAPIARSIALEGAKRLFPYKLVEGENELEKVKEGLKDNKGVLLLTNHFSKRDGILAIQAFLEHLWPLHPRIVMPIAQHQYKEWMGPLVANWGIEMHPIPDLRWEKIKEILKGLPKSQIRERKIQMQAAFEAYLTSAREVLNNGGVVGLAAQARRDSRLLKPKAFPITTILEEGVNSSDNVLIACIGISFAEETDYSDPKVRGYNPGSLFNARLGRIYSLTEAMAEVGPLGVENIDLWVYHQLVDLVPTEYLDETV
jgi:hypothetical protein